MWSGHTSIENIGKIPSAHFKEKRMKAACCGKKRKKRVLEFIDGVPKCKPGCGCQSGVKANKIEKINLKEAPVLLDPNYCGKMMYDEEGAKIKIKKSNGMLKGYYYCNECDAYHTTKQIQSPERQQWFKDNPKLFRNKHV